MGYFFRKHWHAWILVNDDIFRNLNYWVLFTSGKKELWSGNNMISSEEKLKKIPKEFQQLAKKILLIKVLLLLLQKI